MAKLYITLTKSLANQSKSHLATIAALGLKKIGQTVEQEDNPAMRGMVRQVAHLVSCEETAAEGSDT